MRSLLGKNFKLPEQLANHRVECPRAVISGWHRDSGAIDSVPLNVLQVFYYPQDTPVEFGPTELIPGSHFVHIKRRHMMHYGSIRQGRRTAAPAGSIFITHYSIWHRPTTSIARGTRNLMKYQYWRTTELTSDWVVDPDLDFMRVNFRPGNKMTEKFYDAVQVARLFLWLCGQGDGFEYKGGSSWPAIAGKEFRGSERNTEGLPPILVR